MIGGLPVLAADRWEEAGSGAVAILPTPKSASGIAGGSLYCSEQRWAFLFRLAPDTALGVGSGKARLAAADQALELDAEIAADTAKVDVPREVLLPLKEGSGLKVEIRAGKTAVTATFDLSASRAVIEAVAPRCSQIDMSAYEPVTLSQTDPEVPEATKLLKGEIKLFREFTQDEPVIAATTLNLEGGKRLMFASLCGSTSYFGDSGCSLTGYATEGADGAWRMVYETDGVLLYLDRAHTGDGWPNLITLPMVGGTEPTRWSWSGEQYDATEPALSVDDTAVEEQGDKAQ